VAQYLSNYREILKIADFSCSGLNEWLFLNRGANESKGVEHFWHQEVHAPFFVWPGTWFSMSDNDSVTIFYEERCYDENQIDFCIDDNGHMWQCFGPECHLYPSWGELDRNKGAKDIFTARSDPGYRPPALYN
jgi:hypothetical protein